MARVLTEKEIELREEAFSLFIKFYHHQHIKLEDSYLVALVTENEKFKEDYLVSYALSSIDGHHSLVTKLKPKQ